MIPNYNQGTTVVDVNLLNFETSAKNDPPSGLHYHFVFSANTEMDLLSYASREKFYRFVVNCARIQQGNVEVIGGKNESVNLLVSLNPGQNPSDFIKRVKLLTASWARRNLNLSDFAWREEEVATVSESQCSYLSQRIERHSKTFFWRKFSSAN
jgi:hypothetical protein